MSHTDLIILPPEAAHMALFNSVNESPAPEHDDVILSALNGRVISIAGKVDRLQAKAERENRELTAEESALLDGYANELEELDAAITDRQAELADADVRTRRKVSPAGMTQPDAVADRGAIVPQRGADGLFANARGRDANHGFSNFGEYLFALRQTVAGHYDKRLQQPQASYNEGTGADGGFLVPPMFRADILGPAIVESGVLSRVNMIPMPGGNLAVAGMDTEDHTSGSIGGLTMTWTAESAQLSAQTPKVRTINLKAKKGTILVNATNELLMDAPSAPQQLQRLFIEAARYGLEKAILTGNGVGRPLGVLSADALVTVAKEGSQAADTFMRENAVKMLARLHPNLVRSAVWVANPSLLPQLLNLQFRINNAAGSDYVGGSQEPISVSAGQYQLFGIPLVFSEALPTLGDLGDVMLCDFSQYLLGMTLQMGIDVSPHARFEYDETQFRLRVRVDGQPAWSSVLTPENGSTLAPFVTLAERA